MGDLDAQTVEWLTNLKLADKLQYLSDFENGYYMGVVFERMNLARGRKFKNTKDMACKFQNFKNVRDLLMENFKVDFPIQNILFNTQQLLSTLRDCCKRYNRDKKEATLKRIETFSESKIQPHEEKLFASRQREILSTSKMAQTDKFPRKIQQIEQKLEKYRDIKTKHELFALEDRKNELEENRRMIEEHRMFEINKVRTNHEFTKEQERKVLDIWMKTEAIKKSRIEKDNNLNKFQEEKKQKFHQSLRDEDVRSFKEGQEAFQLNCIRQGIELEHDPDKPKIKAEQNFNQQVVMERIKDNIKTHDKERKERIKRENKKAVDAKEANIKSEAIWNENNLVQDYAKKMAAHIGKCNQVYKEINREKAEKKIGSSKALNRTFTELPQSKIDQQARNQQYRRKNIQYLDQTVERLERRQKKHKAIADNVLEAIIQAVISNQDHYYDSKGFTYGEWKKIQNQFLAFEKKDKRIKDHSKYVDSSYDSKAKEYVKMQGVWQSEHETKQNKLELAEVLSALVRKAYPMTAPPTKNEQLPLYMPLKLGLVGDSLSGKTTIAQKLNIKYGVVLINPHAIIQEAFQLNKQPLPEDPKKKKQSKKPEQENPEKTALKEWGAELMKRLNNPASATIEHYIEAIEFKLKYCFEQKVGEQIIKEFEEAKLQQTERLSKALKEFEEIQKKGKKDSKKGGQEPQEPPTERKYFYTKGFVLDGIDLSLENVRILEKKLNGFLSFEERINAKGQEIKQLISNIIPIPEAVKDNRLQNGSFDLLIELDAKAEVIQSRQTAEKPKGHHTDRSQLEKYYSAFGDEQTKRKAYCKVTNETTVEEGLASISKHIESYLDSKYEIIQQIKPTAPVEEPAKPEANHSSVALDLKTVTNKQGQYLIQRFTEVYNKYFAKITESFSEFDSLREEFGKIIISTQQVFISIINRPDDKAGKILNFQQNYNKLLTQKTNIVKDAEASKHLISKFDELYDSLWTSLQAKKNEAVNQRHRVMNSNILNNQIEKTIEVSKKLIENELNLLVQIIFFIYNVSNAINGVKEEVPTEYLVLGIPPTSEPIVSFDSQTFKSSRLEYYINQTANIIKQLPAWLKKRQKKYKITKSEFIDRILAEFIKDRVSHILLRITQIKQRTKEIYLEYYCFFKVLVNKMDDWIILGIKYQNEFVYDIYKNVKKNIQQAKRSNIKDLFVKEITEILHPISSLPPNRLPIVESTKELKLKILSFATFMQEIRCLASSGRIAFKQFTSYIDKRKKSKLLEHEFLTIELDIMQQYLVTDDYCNYKEVALSMLLWNCKILDEDEIAEYQRSLCDKTPNSSGYEFSKEDLTFNEFKIMPGVVKTAQEERILRLFIFQIFREEFRDTISIKQLIETLKLFVQLQVYRYGDTLMMLRQGSHKHIEAPL